MNHNLIQSDEAEWQDETRYWASVQQFSPRRVSLASVIKLIAAGLFAAAVGLMMWVVA